MLRLLLGAAVLAAGLFAGTVQMSPVALSMGDGVGAPTVALAQSCTDGDGSGEWVAPRAPAAPTSQAGWRSRSLHATCVTPFGPRTVVVTHTLHPAPPLPPTTPAHILNSPLLI